MARIAKLRNPIQNYDWGSRVAISEFLGRSAPSQTPEAELWIGDHPKAPSSVETDAGPVSLREWIGSDPGAILGDDVLARFGASLPFLVKLLAADAPLSIQVHPDAAQARDGFAREQRDGPAVDAPNRNYRDDRPKHEILIALEPFYGLCGLRSDDDLRRQIARSASPLASRLLASLLDKGRPLASQLLLAIQDLAGEDRGRLWGEMKAFGDSAAPRTGEAFWVARLCDQHPGDPMVAAPLLLQLVRLQPGESIVMEPGIVHSYLEGFGMEVMTCSDNVVRGGLTTKHIDPDELRKLMRPEPTPPQLHHPVPIGSGRWEYHTGTDAYRIRVQTVTDEEAEVSNLHPTPSVIFSLDGPVEVWADGDGVALRKGEAALVPACIDTYRIAGEGRLFVVTCPERDAEEESS